MKDAQVIGFGFVFFVILFVAMIALGPESFVGKKWNCGYLRRCADQSNQQSQSLSPATGISVVGSPSLTAQKIDNILCNVGSPACGTGNTFYQDSLTSGIDDAYPLAFFKHESSLGTAGAAVETRSIGNIICTASYSCIGRFRAYPSWSDGIDDWYKLISGPGYVGGGLTTVNQIIPKYAPSSDNNDPDGYINAVLSDVQAWRSA